MSISPPPRLNHLLHLTLTPLSTLIGALALSGGIYSLIDPSSFAATLGIPLTPSAPSAPRATHTSPSPSPSSSPSPAIPFVSFAGARNLSSGLTVLALLYTGQRKAVGTLFLCGVAAAMADAWVCVRYGAVEGKAWAHAGMGVVVGLVGWGLWWG